MKQFFKIALATIVGIFLSWIIFLFLIISIGSAISGGEEKVTISDNSILEIDLSADVQDKLDENPFSVLETFNSDLKKPLQLITILQNIEKAKNDPKIKGIAITTGLISTGSAQLSEIRGKLLDFKKSGKFIVSYSEIYTQKAYWLSSLADTIFINPVGALEFKGLAAEIAFFKDFQEKFGIKYDVIRHGKYKSAVEPFITNKMSDANRLQTSKLLHSVWNRYLKDISESRNISIKELNNIADNRLADLPNDALKNGLVDRVAYHDEFIASLNFAIGNNKDEKLKLVDINEYEKVKPEKKKKFSKEKIAVIYAEGEIIYVEGVSSKNVNPKDMVKAIRDIREDDRIKGVVMRVNSPGGSALSSDIIWRELELLKKEKPYVVSFGNVAASGGYYISCGADRIFAKENTITGSIGVFGMIPNAEEAAKKLGITSEVVSTNRHAFERSLLKGASPEIKELILKGVEGIYKTFVKRVADGRKMKQEDVDAIGQGRVWSGKDAIEIGLIDEFGGLQDAIKYVAEKAELENYRIVSYPEKEDSFEKIIKSLSVETRQALLKLELGNEAYNIYSNYNSLKNKEGVQMLMPYSLTIN
jgi:protease-4